MYLQQIYTKDNYSDIFANLHKLKIKLAAKHKKHRCRPSLHWGFVFLDRSADFKIIAWYIWYLYTVHNLFIYIAVTTWYISVQHSNDLTYDYKSMNSLFNKTFSIKYNRTQCRLPVLKCTGTSTEFHALIQHKLKTRMKIIAKSCIIEWKFPCISTLDCSLLSDNQILKVQWNITG